MNINENRNSRSCTAKQSEEMHTSGNRGLHKFRCIYVALGNRGMRSERVKMSLINSATSAQSSEVVELISIAVGRLATHIQ
ncbi:hypothetical protein TNCV_1602681 [Trichonephila clavipes]|nr:hypothetical protein TNCV_1602681 [Trichonephila clavipes]